MIHKKILTKAIIETCRNKLPSCLSARNAGLIIQT